MLIPCSHSLVNSIFIENWPYAASTHAQCVSTIMSLSHQLTYTSKQIEGILQLQHMVFSSREPYADYEISVDFMVAYTELGSGNYKSSLFSNSEGIDLL